MDLGDSIEAMRFNISMLRHEHKMVYCLIKYGLGIMPKSCVYMKKNEKN